MLLLLIENEVALFTNLVYFKVFLGEGLHITNKTI